MPKVEKHLYTRELFKMIKNAYIHIPFCKSKCNYCSFVSYTGVCDEDRQTYVNTLLAEIEHFYKKEVLETLYFGGGTPSLLSVEQLRQVKNAFVLSANAEVTIEVNPDTVDESYLAELKSIGFNRISIGIQSFDDEILKNIGRIHNSQKAVDIVNSAKSVGFNNISVDFIYGLPSQSLENFISDLEKTVELGVSHISLYGLKIEDGCYFDEHQPENLPDEDTQADMYLAAINFLEGKGFIHYEISNFCKENCCSNHNLAYWNSNEYYGFGAAAHGYVNGVRYANYSDLKDYKDKFRYKDISLYIAESNMLEEKIFLGFRKGDGVDVSEIKAKFNVDFEEKYSGILKKYLETGHILKTPKGYKFSNNGFLLSNIILAEFI